MGPCFDWCSGIRFCPHTESLKDMNDIQYLVDDHGDRTAVVIPLEGNEAAVEEFLEDLYGHTKIQERRGEERISKERLLKGLADDGLV